MNKRLRKGRCLFCLLVVFTICHFFFGLFEAKAQADNAQRELMPICVHEGDTLWSIIEENYDYSGDIRAAISEVKSINHMSGSALTAGEVIYVPLR